MWNECLGGIVKMVKKMNYWTVDFLWGDWAINVTSSHICKNAIYDKTLSVHLHKINYVRPLTLC